MGVLAEQVLVNDRADGLRKFAALLAADWPKVSVDTARQGVRGWCREVESCQHGVEKIADMGTALHTAVSDQELLVQAGH